MVSLAALQRNLMLGVFGMNATDRTHLAEISIESSLCEIVQAEEDTKQQLRVLIDVVRKRDVARQSAQLKADLVKSSKLRKTLCALQQKRTGMETQMDKLRESKLNMQMLQSMKHTNMALQNLGFKISDADSIMLDLEEADSDAQAMQNTLSSSFYEDDDHCDLEAELALMLSEDALVATRSKAHAKITLVEPPVHTHMPTVINQITQLDQRPPDEPPSGPELAQAEGPGAGEALRAGEALAVSMVTPVATMYPRKDPPKIKARSRPARKTLLETAPETSETSETETETPETREAVPAA
jgi:hypothetical protein